MSKLDRLVGAALAATALTTSDGFRQALIAQATQPTPAVSSGGVIDTTQAPMPCANAPDRRRFDFWTGEWDVKTKEGVLVGKSNVHQVSGGCGLLENWTSLRGQTGKSLNAFNPQTHQWQQYWVGQGGAVTPYLESEWNGRSLSFVSRPAAGGATQAPTLRLTFTPLDDGSVRQHGEQSTDGGKTWTTTYDLYYHRRS
ncbi:MAG TPA: hypothetical protein VFJ20_00050 [Gemmatimonadaceae bacterium]|nr:hypothetical protein [Gemmatimonadaceae bacterium]